MTSSVLSSLNWTRRHVQHAPDGLSAQDPRRSRVARVASGRAPLNIVRELTDGAQFLVVDEL